MFRLDRYGDEFSFRTCTEQRVWLCNQCVFKRSGSTRRGAPDCSDLVERENVRAFFVSYRSFVAVRRHSFSLFFVRSRIDANVYSVVAFSAAPTASKYDYSNGFRATTVNHCRYETIRSGHAKFVSWFRRVSPAYFGQPCANHSVERLYVRLSTFTNNCTRRSRTNFVSLVPRNFPFFRLLSVCSFFFRLRTHVR